MLFEKMTSIVVFHQKGLKVNLKGARVVLPVLSASVRFPSEMPDLQPDLIFFCVSLWEGRLVGIASEDNQVAKISALFPDARKILCLTHLEKCKSGSDPETLPGLVRRVFEYKSPGLIDGFEEIRFYHGGEIDLDSEPQFKS